MLLAEHTRPDARSYRVRVRACWLEMNLNQTALRKLMPCGIEIVINRVAEERRYRIFFIREI